MNLAPIAERLKVEEGFSAKPYQDSKGVWTIGYGTNITLISRDEAEWLLHNRLSLAADALLAALPWAEALDDARLRVLVDMAYNMGVARLLEFHNTLAAVQRHDWQAAHDGMLASQWAKDVGRRATQLADMMRTGMEPQEVV
jgi:lysozyme